LKLSGTFLHVVELATKVAAHTAALAAMQLVYNGEECIITSKGAGPYSAFSSTYSDAGWRSGFDLQAPISDWHWQH
jgi:hypothetical protein